MDSKLWILVAEDDPNDAFLLRRAFEKNGLRNPTHICSDGEDALAYLRGTGKYQDRKQFPFPEVIFTDLKMPKIDGLQVLQWLQQHPDCQVIPVVVFSSSNLEEDVKAAYELGANAYIRKPPSFDALVEVVKVVAAFWDICEKPPILHGCK